MIEYLGAYLIKYFSHFAHTIILNQIKVGERKEIVKIGIWKKLKGNLIETQNILTCQESSAIQKSNQI